MGMGDRGGNHSDFCVNAGSGNKNSHKIPESDHSREGGAGVGRVCKVVCVKNGIAT